MEMIDEEQRPLKIKKAEVEAICKLEEAQNLIGFIQLAKGILSCSDVEKRSSYTVGGW